MAKIISIGTAVPQHKHLQDDILQFMQKAFAIEEVEGRKLSFLYRQSQIETRHSVIEDFGMPENKWNFLEMNGNGRINPSLNRRMQIFQEHALPLSLEAINNCIAGVLEPTEITHLITVSCTGMSAPGLDLEIAEALSLRQDIFRTSVNFMGCYAAIHALKLAHLISSSHSNAKILIVATELCTIHFQKHFSIDNAASSLLFADGSAAILLSGNSEANKGIHFKNFYSQIAYSGKNDMSWHLSNEGFLMTLSAYVPQLIQEDINALVDNALQHAGITKTDVTHWCIHPGGKKILDVIQKKLDLTDEDLQFSRNVLRQYGNLSSATILFVLNEMLQNIGDEKATIFGVAFGPGLTMETFIASNV